MSKLAELAKIAKEVADLSVDSGYAWHDLTTGLRGYNATSSDHQAAEIFGLHVGLHNPPQFGFTEQKFDDLDNIIELAKKELKAYKQKQSKETRAKRERERKEQIATLKKRLERLEKPKSQLLKEEGSE